MFTNPNSAFFGAFAFAFAFGAGPARAMARGRSLTETSGFNIPAVEMLISVQRTQVSQLTASSGTSSCFQFLFV